MKKIFIAGVPGMGKTTIGNYLADNFGFIHHDFEDGRSWVVEEIINQTSQSNKDVVITWGFGPDMPAHTDIVHSLLQSGFKMIWLDGNREAAHREYTKRGTVSEELLELQMKQINNVDIASTFHPIFYNTFDENGTFKPLDKISKELLAF